jgi:hypothetical protein
MLQTMYESIMDPHKNPLGRLPKYVRFQLMTILSILWTTIFTVWSGYTYFFGPSVMIHMLIALGVIFTAEIFRYAKEMTRSISVSPS